ncbi:MAG TPA: phage major tail tube protein [Chthoniobacteraceae bacterium]|nr:phage major tail tube protein [Chthoniobacteraceae bacterium]
MSAADQILKNFNLFVDGRGYAGNCPTFRPPALQVLEEEFRAGGLDAPIKVDMGMEALEASFTLTKFAPEVLALWGLSDGTGKQITARGAVQNLNGTVEPVIVNLAGNIRAVESGDWVAGEKVENEFTVSVVSYKYTQAGRLIHHIDVPNMIRIVNGVDHLAAIRDAIGL